MSKLIGIFATEISSRVQGILYTKLHDKAKELGYNLVFFSANLSRINVNDTDKHAMELFGIAENMDFEAIIIHAQSVKTTEYVDAVIEMGHRKNIPVFVYDCATMGYTKDAGIITINPDYKQGFAESVRHIIEHHNCKNIYMLAGMKDNKFSEERIDAYREEMLAHGLPVSEDNIFYGDFWEIPAQAAVNALLDSDLPRPDAICCANDSMAIAAAAVLNSRGYKVPDDVRITGFDGIEDGKFNFPVIATCQPVIEIVPDFIFDSIDRGDRSGEFLIPLRFCPKESCGCENSDFINDRIEMSHILESVKHNSWQHSMLSNMQLQLMDSTNYEDITAYMYGIIAMFKGYKHLYCIRDNIDCQEDISAPLDKMQVQLNLEFMPQKDYEVFRVSDIMPGYEQVVKNADANQLFIFRLLQSEEKVYGYSVIRADYYSTTQIKIFAQFSESFTNMMEGIQRNRRLEQANQKLSEMYERMSEIYIRDMMTGLYNRTGYYNELNDYLSREDMKDKYIHVVAVDMDGMKIINDNYGHQEGDIAIKAVARAINDCFAHPCISARFGGDEFMVSLISDSADKPTAQMISVRLNSYLSTMPMLKDKKYTVGVSVGYAVSRISEMPDIKVLEKMADDVMYIDKRSRKGQQ